jgi:hypothetical protein
MLLKVKVINFRAASCAYDGPYSTVEAVVMASNPKPCGYINLSCQVARSHICLLRRPIGEREALRHALAVVGSSGPTLRKS